MFPHSPIGRAHWRASNFVGSGDVKPGAFAYWAVSRVYNLAYALLRGPVMNLVDQAGANLITIYCLYNGRVDIAAINAWVLAHGVTGIKVTKLFDTTGNGWHVSQATLANMPALLMTHPGFGNDPNLPTMDFTRSAAMKLVSGATGLSSSVGTFSIVGRAASVPVNPFTNNVTNAVVQAGSFGVAYNNSSLQCYAGSIGQPLNINTDQFNALQCVFNGASSFSYANGSVTLTGGGSATYNVGASALGSPFTIGLWNGGNSTQGNISEIRFDATAWAAADCLADVANQKAFYFNSPKYEGLVCTRMRARYTSETVNKYCQSRSAHFATDDITALKVNVKNTGVTTASIEYPAGTFTQLKWLGATSLPGAGIDVFTDYATVSIPKGAQFWYWEYNDISVSGTLHYNTWQNSFLGEACAVSTTAQTDLTMTGGLTNSGTPSGLSVPPRLIVAVTANASVIVIGDSVAFGSADVEDTSSSATGYNGAVGFIGRALTAAGIAFANYAVSGQDAGNYATNGTSLILGKGSHILSEFSINDFQFGKTYAQIQGYLTSIFGFVGPVQKIIQTTNTPKSNSTDSWATLGNQSQNSAGYDTAHVLFNDNLRAGTTGIPRLSGFIDVAGATESSLDSCKWAFPGYTPDGIHMTTAGHTAVATSGIMAPLTMR